MRSLANIYVEIAQLHKILKAVSIHVGLAFKKAYRAKSPQRNALSTARTAALLCKESLTIATNPQNRKGNTMPTMPPEAANRPKPKVPYAENNFMDLPKPVVPKTENRKLLKDQKAIVTGASSGIGRSIALALGHAGAAVCVNYVAGEDKAQAMVDELRGHGHTAFSFRADVSSETEVAAMFEAVRDEFGMRQT
jgi:hypothetical protein